MFRATWAAYAKKMMEGPTTKPFQPSETIPKLTPARTAYDRAARRSFETAENAETKDINEGEDVRSNRSVPAYFTARSQNMNPSVMNSMMKASWSASAHVV